MAGAGQLGPKPTLSLPTHPVFFLCFRGMVAGPFKRGKLARRGKKGKTINLTQ